MCRQQHSVNTITFELTVAQLQKSWRKDMDPLQFQHLSQGFFIFANKAEETR